MRAAYVINSSLLHSEFKDLINLLVPSGTMEEVLAIQKVLLQKWEIQFVMKPVMWMLIRMCMNEKCEMRGHAKKRDCEILERTLMNKYWMCVTNVCESSESNFEWVPYGFQSEW